MDATVIAVIEISNRVGLLRVSFLVSNASR
jgi:hypothetical protein